MEIDKALILEACKKTPFFLLNSIDQVFYLNYLPQK